MEFIHNDNDITVYSNDGIILATVTFPGAGDNVVEVNHTFVDNSLRGQGVASRLMKELAEELRTSNRKAVFTCSYAIGWFQKHPEYRDVEKK